MFKKLWKNREEFWILTGNILVTLFFIVSFGFFLNFAVRTVTQAVTVVNINAGTEKEFNKDAYEKITVLLNRTSKGFSVLEKEKTETVGSSSSNQ